VLGLPGIDGDLRVAGVTLPLTDRQAWEVAAALVPATMEHPWPTDLRLSGLGATPCR
jgi:hypothetical protein